jgi:hypothetical protein
MEFNLDNFYEETAQDAESARSYIGWYVYFICEDEGAETIKEIRDLYIENETPPEAILIKVRDILFEPYVISYKGKEISVSGIYVIKPANVKTDNEKTTVNKQYLYNLADMMDSNFGDEFKDLIAKEEIPEEAPVKEVINHLINIIYKLNSNLGVKITNKLTSEFSKDDFDLFEDNGIPTDFNEGDVVKNVVELFKCIKSTIETKSCFEDNLKDISSSVYDIEQNLKCINDRLKDCDI